MRKNVHIVSLVSFIEGVAAFSWLASIPASGGTYSPVRLASLSGIFLVSLGSLFVFIYSRSENRFSKKIDQFVSGGAGRYIALLFVSLAFVGWGTIINRDLFISLFDEAVYIRLLPITVYGVLFCLQFGVLFLVPYIEKISWTDTLRSIWKPTLILLGCFVAVWAFMAISHIGFNFDDVGLSWGPPGTPVTFVQVIMVFMIALLLVLVYFVFKVKFPHGPLPVRDVIIFVALWGLAAFLWWNEPVSETHFNPSPMEPNYEYYPNSDAMIFDRSSYHLIFGTGFSNQLIRRPLYVGMLALFHKLGGFGYENTIFFQILFLALIPPLTYLLASRLSNRLAGLVAGGLILLREKNAIELSNRIVTANAKLMMSDMVAMLGVIVFVYLVVRVFSEKERSIWLLGIAGASLGLTALVRAQVFILIPPLLLFLVMEKRPIKNRLRNSFLIMAGMVLVMSPWVWRNWKLTGTFVLDDRGEEKLLARNYSETPAGFPEFLPGETEKEYSARIKRGVFTYMIEHPADVASFVSNHFFRNLSTGVVYIAPVYSTDSPRNLVDHTHFWDEWMGELTDNGGIPLFINLMFIAAGVGAAQTKERYAGWFPFVAFLFYSGGNALVRSSGWRFAMPADWIILVYYSIALAYLPSRIKFVLENVETDRVGSKISFANRKPVLGGIVFCLFLLTGASVPIAERLIPARDLSYLTEDAVDVLSRENIISREQLASFLEQENAVMYSGIALYPRYVSLKSRIYLAYAPTEYPFLHFWLINDGDHQIVLPLQRSPGSFQHTARVSIIGCQENNYIATWAVIEHSPESKVILQEPHFPLSCPLPSPAQE